MITLALLAQCVDALPDKPLTQEKLAQPQGRRALRWLGRLSNVNAAELVAWSERGVAARRWLLAPFAPLFRTVALRQQWNLFLTVSDEAFRMRIEVQAQNDETWRLIYHAQELDLLGLEPLLSYRRVRVVYNPNKYGVRGSYEAFTRWLAQRVFREHPELTALRVSMERLNVGDPHVPARVLETLYATEHTRE